MRLTRKRSRAPAILFSEQFPEKSNPGLVVPHCAPCPLHWCSDEAEANPKPQECCFEQALLAPSNPQGHHVAQLLDNSWGGAVFL